jgi:hypothetical protein
MHHRVGTAHTRGHIRRHRGVALDDPKAGVLLFDASRIADQHGHLPTARQGGVYHTRSGVSRGSKYGDLHGGCSRLNVDTVNFTHDVHRVNMRGRK